MHIKRLAAPRSWDINRKGKRFIKNTRPGPHSKASSIPLVVLCRDVLGVVKTSRDADLLLNSGAVTVDGAVRKESGFPVGFMDVVKIGQSSYRITLDKKGFVKPISIPSSETDKKVVMITGKRMVRGDKVQLSFHDGRNALLPKTQGKKYSTESSVLIEVPSQKVLEYMPFKKGATVFVNGGRHVGETSVIEDIIRVEGTYLNKVVLRSGKTTYETLQRFAFVVGDTKPVVKVE